jgi:hypothetical protein
VNDEEWTELLDEEGLLDEDKWEAKVISVLISKWSLLNPNSSREIREATLRAETASDWESEKRVASIIGTGLRSWRKYILDAQMVALSPKEAVVPGMSFTFFAPVSDFISEEHPLQSAIELSRTGLDGAQQNLRKENALLGAKAHQAFVTLLYVEEAGNARLAFLDIRFMWLAIGSTDITLIYERMKDVQNYLEAGKQNCTIKDFLVTMNDGVEHPGWDNYDEAEKV